MQGRRQTQQPSMIAWHGCPGLRHLCSVKSKTTGKQAAVRAPGEHEVEGQHDEHANDDVGDSRVEQVHAASIAWHRPAQPSSASTLFCPCMHWP